MLLSQSLFRGRFLFWGNWQSKKVPPLTPPNMGGGQVSPLLKGFSL